MINSSSHTINRSIQQAFPAHHSSRPSRNSFQSSYSLLRRCQQPRRSLLTVIISPNQLLQTPKAYGSHLASTAAPISLSLPLTSSNHDVNSTSPVQIRVHSPPEPISVHRAVNPAHRRGSDPLSTLLADVVAHNSRVCSLLIDTNIITSISDLSSITQSTTPPTTCPCPSHCRLRLFLCRVAPDAVASSSPRNRRSAFAANAHCQFPILASFSDAPKPVSLVNHRRS
ncbi:hypothetical protein M0R45_035871 [Rubus argutus]|uniref:Uncharacterized protein n=1 Tax=Rubus argutus TaxID=59490 RepID=A0AAW1VZY0_RUBAR